ncbi:MAG: hypothetical protein M3546_17345 [Actinomycetota bacterium]|nr:hypothetical protein [Actinomycetota bacterium]
MKMKFLLVALVIASLGVSAAAAAPPPGKGKPPTTGEGCKPKVTVVLKGTLAVEPVEPVAPVTTLSVNVTKANRHGRAYVSALAVTVTVNADTKVRRQGKKALADLEVGDRVLVQARVCKADLVEGATPPVLTASKVVAHPASA